MPNVKDLIDVNLTADKYKNLPWRLGLDSELNKIDIIFDRNSQWLISAPKLNFEFEKHTDNILSENELDKPDEINKDEMVENQKEKYNNHNSVYSSIHDMDIHCASCSINNISLGEIKASIRNDTKMNRGISIKAKVSNGKKHNLSFNANWSMNILGLDLSSSVKDNSFDYSTVEMTNVDFILSTNNVGTLLKEWGFEPSVEDSKGTVVGDFTWSNSPWNIDYKKIEGSARLDLGKGYLSDISDEDGRILTLFNFQSILRKLTFDFKDVYKKGFFYDSMGGTIYFSDGIISTYDTSLKGNVADVWLFGTTDLNKRNFNQHVIVSPHITSSFPVLAAWALEPTTGIIVYLLNKLMEPAINVATQIDYKVTGSFDSPEVSEIKKSSKKVKINLDENLINNDVTSQKSINQNDNKDNTGIEAKEKVSEQLSDKSISIDKPKEEAEQEQGDNQ